MLELKNICKTFNGGTVNEKKVFEDLNLTLNEGDFVTVAECLLQEYFRAVHLCGIKLGGADNYPFSFVFTGFYHGKLFVLEVCVVCHTDLATFLLSDSNFSFAGGNLLTFAVKSIGVAKFYGVICLIFVVHYCLQKI